MRTMVLSILIVIVGGCATSDSAFRSEKQIHDLQLEVSILKSDISFMKGKLDVLEKLISKTAVAPSGVQSPPMQGQPQPPSKSTEQKVVPATPPASQPSVKPTSTRCQAITKKGTQCSRAAKPGSNYCWQHGG